MEQWVADLLRPEHLSAAVGLWQAASEPELISAVENFVYFLERDGRAHSHSSDRPDSVRDARYTGQEQRNSED